MKKVFAIFVLALLLIGSIVSVFGDEYEMSEEERARSEGMSPEEREIFMAETGVQVSGNAGINANVDSGVRAGFNDGQEDEASDEDAESVFPSEDSMTDDERGMYNRMSGEERMRGKKMFYSALSAEERENLRAMSSMEKKKFLMDRHSEIMDRFEKKKMQYAEARETYESDREDFAEKMMKWKEMCRQNSDAEGCNELGDERFAAAKKYLLQAIDTLTAVLEKKRLNYEQWGAKLEGADDFSKREDMLDVLGERVASVDEQIEALASLRAEAESAETTDEIKNIGMELKDFWSDTRSELSLGAGIQFAERLEHMLVKSERLQEKLGEMIEKFGGAEGAKEFDGFIERARSILEQAKTECDAGDADNCKKLLKEAHEQLKEAHSALKETLKRARASGDAELNVATE